MSQEFSAKLCLDSLVKLFKKQCPPKNNLHILPKKFIMDIVFWII